MKIVRFFIYLVLLGIIIFLYSKNRFLSSTILELNRVVELDYDLIQATLDYNTSIYYAFHIANDMNTGLLKNTISDDELLDSVVSLSEYSVKAEQAQTKQEEIDNMRSDYINNLKYAEKIDR